MPDLTELISAKEAANRLGLSHSRVTILCHTGVLKFQRIGNQLCIDPQSVEDARNRKNGAGRPRKWKYEPIVAELRKRGYERLASQVERIFKTE